MTKRSKLEVTLYTLRVDGVAIAVAALRNDALKRNEGGAIRDAFFEAWLFGGGDLRKLVGRELVAGPPSDEERETWFATVETAGKPIAVLGGEAMGTA